MNESHTKKYLSSFSMLCIFLLMFYFQLPSLSSEANRSLVIPFAVLLVLYFCSSFSKYMKSIKRPRVLMAVFSVMMFMLIEASYKFAGISKGPMGFSFTTVKFMICAIVIIPAYVFMSDKQKMVLLKFTVAANYIIMIFLTFEFYRYGSKYADTLQIGITQYATSLIFFAGTLYIGFMMSEKVREKRLFLILMIVSIVFSMIVAQKGIVFFLTIILLFLLTLFGRKNTRRQFIATMIFGLAAVVIMVNYESVLLGISDMISSDRLAVRIRRMITLIKEGDFEEAGGSFSGRYELILNSWNTFLGSGQHFFIGVGDHEGNRIVGHHSQFVDILAQYGIIGGTVVVVMLKYFFRNIVFVAECMKHKRLYRCIVVMAGVFIIRGLIGTVFHSAVAVQIFCVLPLMCWYLSKNKNEVNEK